MDAEDSLKESYNVFFSPSIFGRSVKNVTSLPLFVSVQ